MLCSVSANYLLYDAEGLYLSSPLMGFRLVKGVYEPIPPGVADEIHSDVLGLDFHIREGRLRVYDPVREQWLQTPAEQHAARAETAEARAERETIARQQQLARAETAEARVKTAEAEVERLREQLARLDARP